LFGADNDVVSLALCPLTEDTPMRALRDPEVHTAVAATVPPVARWLAVADPISEVFVMGGLHNTLRRLIVDDRPVALRLHAVGDAVCTTNPTLGRGVTLALQGAADLRAAIADFVDPVGQALAMDGAITEHLKPWYADQAAADSARLVAMRSALRGDPPTPLPDIALGVTPEHVMAAAMVDAEVFRAFSSLIGMLRTPAEVYGSKLVQDQVRATFASGAVPPPPPQITRPELLAALG
jgi:2-polyprenyl-6-methoxyphenol hydroxylase-like FAD-dependent oxidoreductase